MAVQAQYPSNALSPDIGSRSRNGVLEDLQMLQDRTRHHHLGNLLGACSHPGELYPPSSWGAHSTVVIGAAGGQHHGFNNCTVFSDPTSELTGNASGPRKRFREEDPIVLPLPSSNQNALPVFRYPTLDLGAFPLKPNNAAQLLDQQSRLLESAGTSTSGRPDSVSAASSTLVVSPLSQEIAYHLYHQNIEIDALVRLQNERLRSGLEEARKRYCRALVSAVEQRVAKRLREKEAELENASRRNAELEEKVRQMSAENQIWFNVAKNNEGIVNSLKTSLEQVLLQNMASAAAAGSQGCDGYGDGEGAETFPADDAQSCCFEEDEKERRMALAARQNEEELLRRRACRSCQERDVCVLLFPCRHLCLCKDCEPSVDSCPICHSIKSDCIQIFMS